MTDKDDIAAAKAAADQIDAVMRDLWLPAVIRIEQRVRRMGGSRKLAAAMATTYFESLLWKAFKEHA